MAPQTTSALMTTQPWVASANQLCLLKSTPGIWSMSQFTTPKSASTIHTKTWDETSCGMAQTSIIAMVMAIRTQGETRRISRAMPRPSSTEIVTEVKVNMTVRRTTFQNTRVGEQLGVVVEADPLDRPGPDSCASS